MSAEAKYVALLFSLTETPLNVRKITAQPEQPAIEELPIWKFRN